MALPRSFQAESECQGRFRQLVPALHAEATREWRAKNPDYLERYNAQRRAEYRAEHPLPTRPCIVCGMPFTGRPDALV